MSREYKYQSLIQAVRSNDIDEFKRMYQAGFQCKDVCTLTSEAGGYGHLEFLKYLLCIGFRMDKMVLIKAATHGHLHILKFAIENGCDINVTVIQCAVYHVECLKYLYEQKPDLFGHPLRMTLCNEQLAMEGCLDSIKFFQSISHNWTWSDQLPARAAVSGHLECLKYFLENGCPHDYRVIHDACVTGEFECIKYAVEHGCDYDDRAIRQAIENHNFDCARYLLGSFIKSDGRDVCWGFKSKMFDSFNACLTMYIPSRHDWAVMYLCKCVDTGELMLDQYPKVKTYVTDFLRWKQGTTLAVFQTVGLFVCDDPVDKHVLRFIFPRPL